MVQLAVGANRSVQFVQKPTQAQRPHVHDVASWLKPFTVYTRVIVAAAPDRANDLLAYQATILDANNSYHVDAWLSYDRRFRRAIASQPLSYDWAIIDSNLWQSSFTSRGRPPCSRCSLVHPVAQARCPFRPEPPSDGAGSGGPLQSSAPAHLGKPICRNFNRDQCNNSVRRNYWSVGDTHFHKHLRFTCWESMRVLESHPEHFFSFFFQLQYSCIFHCKAVLDCCVRCSNEVDIQSLRQST